MARIRTVKPSFFQHFELYQAEVETALPLRVAYAGLWTQSDREGRFKWSAPELKLGCLPYDNLEFSRVLDALESRGFIVKYRENGRDFGWIPSFKDHQMINNKESESILPEPNENNILTCEGREDHALQSCLILSQGEGKGKERKENKHAKGTRLSQDWEMPPDWGNWALNEKPDWDNEKVLLIAAGFKDYWIAKPGAIACKLDWFATWRNWVRNTK